MYSVGEEISLSYPIAISWSPPGLANHRRCALAALAANLVLSIWAPDGKPLENSNWDRRLIVNDALADYWSDATPQEGESKVAFKDEETAILRRRIRAFSWAPSVHCTSPRGIVGTQMSWGQPMVAVSDDDNHVVLLAINSPASTMGAHENWSADVLSHFAIDAEHMNPINEQGTFDELMQQQRHVSHLEWSPWVKKGDILRSVLAYATNEEVRARTITVSNGTTIKLGEVNVYANLEMRYAGPLVWSPQANDDGTLTLALFTNTEVVSLTISSEDATIIKRQSHHLDDRWDIISGVAWDIHHDEKTSLHFCSQTMTTRSPTAALELSASGLNNVSTTQWPYWREQINGTQGHFSAHHGLAGHANAKVWGLAESPLGDFVAACYTVHPTDMIEYGTPNDRETTLSISDMWARGDDMGFPRRAISAEGIYYTIRKWIEKEVETAEDLPVLKAEVHKKLVDTYQAPGSTMCCIAYDSTDLNVILEAFKGQTFLDANILKDRYEVLVSTICTPDESVELPKTLIAFRLAKALHSIPSRLFDSHQFSQQIIEMGQQVIRLVNDLMSDVDMVTEADAAGDVDPNAPAHSRPAPAPSHYAELTTETCTFCTAPIPFENLWAAYCTNGHEFQRCGLSFLAIQAPGITKQCGICNTRFFSDEHVARDGVLVDELATEAVGVDGDGVEDTTMADVQPTNGHTESSDMPATIAANVENDTKPTSDLLPFIEHDEDANNEEDSMQVDTDAPSKRSEQTHSTGRAGVRGERASRVSGVKPYARPTRKEIPVNLARVLFLGCDVCIYCGGKFMG